MTDTLTELAVVTDFDALTFGQPAIYRHDGTDYPVTVRGFYGVNGSRNNVWVTSPDLPTDSGPYAYPQGSVSGDTDFTWADRTGPWLQEPGTWTGSASQGRLFLAPETTPEPVESDEVVRLRAQVSDLQSQVDTARTVLTHIGTALQETADLHEWCGEYDRRVNELVDSLPGRYGFDDTFREAAQRDREYEVCVHWTETVEHSTTVTVTASSESAAVDMVSDSPQNWVASDDRYSVNERSVEWDEIHID